MSPKVTNIFIFLVIAVLSFVLFANSMTKSLARDEQTYCTAAVLMAQGKTIYRDFSYSSQMPYHPLLCAVLFRVLNTTHFLLVVRILSCLCDVLVVVCIIGIYRRLFRPFPLSALLLAPSAAVLYVFNPFVDYANGLAWNNDVVVFCVALSFWIFISIDFSKKSKYWRIAFVAALLTLATFMRITLALVQLLFFAALLNLPVDSIKQRFKNILPFLIATFLVALWPLYTIALAPRAFFLNLYWVSVLNNKALHRTGLFFSKSYMLIIFLTTLGCFILVLIAIYLCAAVLWKRRKSAIPPPDNTLFAVLLAFTFIIIAFMMPTMWKQHLAMPVPFVIISFAFPLLYLRKLSSGTGPNKRFKMARLLMVACAVTTVVSYPRIFNGVPKLFDLQSWTPIRLHSISEDIAEKAQSPKLILTLAPLYALEGGCDIYIEFSSGPFVYRIANKLSESDRHLTHTVGPIGLPELFEKSPPSAMVFGVESEFLEISLFQAVDSNPRKWKIKAYEDGSVVYFRR